MSFLSEPYCSVKSEKYPCKRKMPAGIFSRITSCRQCRKPYRRQRVSPPAFYPQHRRLCRKQRIFPPASYPRHRRPSRRQQVSCRQCHMQSRRLRVSCHRHRRQSRRRRVSCRRCRRPSHKQTQPFLLFLCRTGSSKTFLDPPCIYGLTTKFIIQRQSRTL